MTRGLLGLCLTAALAACTGRPLLHREPVPYSAEGMEHIGNAAFALVEHHTPRVDVVSQQDTARCVVRALTAHAAPPSGALWEAEVFDLAPAGAFALPGGKLGVYAGLFAATGDVDRLAAILAHQVAHVVADHANTRLTTAYMAASPVELVDAMQHSSASATRYLLAILGASPPLGDVVPFGAEQESEADRIGLELMSAAGFDPGAAPAAWEGLADGEAGTARAFLATHPSVEAHRRELESQMPAAVKRYRAKRAAGSLPRCGQGPEAAARPRHGSAA